MEKWSFLWKFKFFFWGGGGGGRCGIYKISFQFFHRAVILQGEIIKKRIKKMLFFHEDSIHEVSRRYLIPEYHSCKISGSKILKKGNNSKNIT